MGQRLMYEHEVFETPLNYGEPLYFEAIPPGTAKEQLLMFAKRRKVEDQYLEDG